MGKEEIAELAQNSLLYHDKNRYRLISWVIMPNHVHILFTPLEGEHMSDIMHSIKSYTAQESNKILGRAGQFWQYEAFDRYIRNRRHFNNVIRYIEENPVKAGLCDKPEEWRFGSAYFKNRDTGD